MRPVLASMLGVFCLLVRGAPAEGSWTSEGTEFAIALASSHDPFNNAEIIINARQTTEVTITTSFSNEVVIVPGGWSEVVEVDYNMRVENGIESNGILIASELPVSVHVATVVESPELYTAHAPDSCLVRPLSSTSVEYFLAGYSDFTFEQRPASFYIVAAAEDDTVIDVIYPAGLGLENEHFTLDSHATFTLDVYFIENLDFVDFTGTRILASKPVAVYSGGQVNLAAESANPEPKYLFASMPSLFEIGMDYTTFPVHYGGDGGYEVRVIAVANDTRVVIPSFDVDTSLNMGQFHVVDNLQTWFGFHVSCSVPCMVAQYVRTLPADSENEVLAMHPFLAALTPDHRATDDLIFTVPSMAYDSPGMRTAISITVNAFPVTGVHLNGTSLADLTWQAVDGSQHSYGTVEVEAPGFYRLHTIEPEERFTAYLYVLQSDSDLGPAPGFPIGYGGTISNAGTRFALALPPAASLVDAELILHSAQDTTVILTYPFLIYQPINLEANVVTHHQLSGSQWRCIEGIEHKGLTLSSDQPFSAHLSNAMFSDASDPDSTILRPIPDSPSDVYIVSYAESSTNAKPMAFYMVVAYEADTDVVVYEQEESSQRVLESFSLGANEVFTKDSFVEAVTTMAPPDPTTRKETTVKATTVDDFTGSLLESFELEDRDATAKKHLLISKQADHKRPDVHVKNANDSHYPSDFTGIFIRASKPVAVFSGHGHAHVPSDGLQPGHLFESMPYTKELGWKTYVTLPYHFGDSGAGYIVRVLSVASETRINVPALGYDAIHDAGTFYEFSYPLSRFSTTVYCSRGCTVAQYANEAGAGDSPGAASIHPFMLVLTPDVYFSRNVTFSSPSGASGNASLALSLVVDFFPVDDLFLDGVSLSDLAWQSAPEGVAAYATVSIQPGQRHLYTEQYGHRFAAYLIGTLEDKALSFGYAVSYAGE